MDLMSLVVALIVMGLVWWLVSTYLPIPQPFKNVILVLLVVLLIVWLLNSVGYLGNDFLHRRL